MCDEQQFPNLLHFTNRLWMSFPDECVAIFWNLNFHRRELFSYAIKYNIHNSLIEEDDNDDGGSEVVVEDENG